MSLGLVAVGLIASGVVSYLLYNSYSNQIRDDLRRRLINISDIAALQLDAAKLDTINGEADTQDETYMAYEEFLFDVVERESDIIYIYTMRKAEDGNIYFYLDAGRETTIEEYEPGIPGGVVYDEPSDLLLTMFNSPGETTAEEDIYTDEFGAFLSAYTPIFNADGTLHSVLGVDIKADAVIAQEKNVLMKTALFFFISTGIIAILGLFLGDRFSRATVALTQAANEIAGGKTYPITSLPSPSSETHQLMIAFNTMTGKLGDLIVHLEESVEKRTSQLRKRAGQLEAISSVARSTATLQSLDELLPATTELISDRFGYYHTGIFLLDENREFAVLRASNSEGGKRMLARQHKLKLDTNSIVGYAVIHGEPRIALDVGTDAVYFNNPDLPDTRSEIALPLRVGGRVIGALDVQSTIPNAFATEDIATLATLADQVAIAIENSRLFGEAREALKESEETLARYVKQQWQAFSSKSESTGYRYDGKQTIPLEKKNDASVARPLPQTGSLALARESGKLSVPIRFRGQVIGVLDVNSKNKTRTWTQDDLTLIEAAVERAALALENARLVEDSQRRAARERTIGEISTKIGAVSNMEAIMQVAVEELGRRIGGAAEVTVELGENDNQDVS